MVGLTRSRDKLALVRELGAEPALCDVYDVDALLDLVQGVRPQTVVNFVTDLTSRSAAANNRARREAGDNLCDAATAAGAARLCIESVAFELKGESAKALEHLERSAQAFAGDVLVLRFGRLWGPGTSHATAPAPPAIHVEEAGAEAARLLVDAPPGTYTVA